MNEIHHSLYEDLADELSEPISQPPVPIFDHHMHIGSVKATRHYVAAASAYGVKRALGLASVGQSKETTRAFGDFFLYCGWCRTRDVAYESLPVDAMIREIEEMAEAGFVALKFKIVPDVNGRAPEIWLDEPRLRPLFERAVDLGFCVQAHIAQPDVWFERDYDEELAGPKEHYFRQVEYLLEEFPGLAYVGIHMGGHPEDLDYLDELMERFGHFGVDTSATKWVVRELSAQAEKAREFFLRRADRIYFGSDLVVQEQVEDSYYTSRFHVQRTMWETDFRGRSMIKDPDHPSVPFLWGLDLPRETIEQIYWNNAARLLGI